MILDRPAFYDVLLKKLPKHKILYGKRVQSIEQDTYSARVKCADGRWVSLSGVFTKALSSLSHTYTGTYTRRLTHIPTCFTDR